MLKPTNSNLCKQKLTATLFLVVHQGSLILSRQSEKSFLECDVECSDGSLLVGPVPLQILDCLPLRESVAGRAVAVVVSVYPTEPLHLLDDLHRVLLD